MLQTGIRRFLAKQRTHKLRLDLASRNSHQGSRQVSTFQHGSMPSPGREVQEKMAQAVAASPDRNIGNDDQSNPMAQEDFFYDLAAIQIQCVFRGWWVRDSIAVDT